MSEDVYFSEARDAPPSIVAVASFPGRSLLHALERVFVQMTRDETLPAVRQRIFRAQAPQTSGFAA